MTDTWFESNLTVIKKEYMNNKQENQKSVAELMYGFFYFYVYEFDQHRQMIDISCGDGFSTKSGKDMYPFSIVDPFDTGRNPGQSVKMGSKQHKIVMMQMRVALDRFKD